MIHYLFSGNWTVGGIGIALGVGLVALKYALFRRIDRRSQRDGGEAR
jgi:hypothetical protein